MLYPCYETAFVFKLNALEMCSESISCVCMPGTMMNPKFSMKIIQIISNTHFPLVKIMVLRKKNHFEQVQNINGTKLMGSSSLY